MKIIFKLLIIFIGSISFLSCEEVIDLEVPSSDPKLVIDAIIGFDNVFNTPVTVGEVRLTLSAPFFNEEIPPATNANVQLVDEFTGEVHVLEEDEPGVFRDGFPDLIFDRDYTLEIRYNGDLYSATQQLIRTGTIESLEQGDGFIFDEEDETEIIVNFQDIPNERNRYLFTFGRDEFLVLDDEFFQDQLFQFSFFFEGLDPGENLPVTLLGTDENFANYVTLILTQSTETGGNGTFAVPPSTIRGNLVNETNPANFPLGYFAMGEFNAAIFMTEEE